MVEDVGAHNQSVIKMALHFFNKKIIYEDHFASWFMCTLIPKRHKCSTLVLRKGYTLKPGMASLSLGPLPRLILLVA